MANAPSRSANAPAAPSFSRDEGVVNPFFDFSAAFDAALCAQRQQWEMLAAWQKSLAEWQQDAWDQWISHWGGGVPIDA